MQTTTSHLKRNNSVVTTDIQNELLIYNPVNKVVHVLNSSGKCIWNNLNNSVEADKLIIALKSISSNEDLNIVSDIEHFLLELENQGLLLSGADSESDSLDITFPIDFKYITPKVETYSEEFLREHLKDTSFATFHDDTYNDLS
jgi:hypothetical protein